MTQIVDEDGFILGYVNIVDAGIVLIIAAVVAGGYVLVTAAGGGASVTATATLDATLHPDTVDELYPGLHGDHVTVTGIQGTQRVEQVLIDGSTRERVRVTFTATFPAEIDSTDAGLERVYWTRGGIGRERLAVGSRVELDFGRVVVDAIVTDLDVEEAEP